MKSKVLIKNPCTRDLDRMPRTATGVFCTRCREKVEDQTRFTDEELIKWLSDNRKEKPCGIYRPDQARIPFLQRVSLPFRYAAISLVSLFSLKEAQAQAPAVIPVQDAGKTVLPGDTQQKRITGQAVLKKGGPAGGVTVFVSGADSTIVTMHTNEDGRFECVLPYTSDTTFTITFSKRGYDIETVYGYVPCDMELKVAIKKSGRKTKNRQRRIASKF